MRSSRLLALALAALGATALPTPAAGSFPGRNGDIVAAVGACEEGRRLVSVPWRGGELTPVTPECEMSEDDYFGGTEIFQPDASPDGESIIAVQRHEKSGFVTMAADGSARGLVPLPDGVGGWEPSFAPDGERFGFTEGLGTLSVARLDGTGYRRLSPPCTTGNCVGFTEPRWSPDGRLIAVQVEHYGTVPRRPRPLPRGLWLLRASDGKPVRRIAGVRTREVDWAPDGRSLVFGSPWGRDGTDASGGNLYRVGRDGRDLRLLVHRERIAEVSPSWSPDGRWISWVSLRFKGGGDVSYDVIASIWRKRVRGGRPQRVVRLPSPWVDGGFFDAPHITWLPRP